MKLLYNITYCTLWREPRKSITVCALPADSVLYDMDARENGYAKVTYPSNHEYVGWVDDKYLQLLQYSTPTNIIELDHPTASLQDLNQYIFMDGKVQYNLCGELCVCYSAGVPKLSQLLELWKAKPTSAYNRIFKNGISATTGVSDLKDMLSVLPLRQQQSLADMYGMHGLNGQNGKIIINPTRLENTLCFGWKVVVGVRIDYRGRLKNKGILHWVTISNAVANGFDGWITYYNPASNNIEEIGWDAFRDSMGSPFGIAVRQDVIHLNDIN